jgi:protein SCO1
MNQHRPKGNPGVARVLFVFLLALSLAAAACKSGGQGDEKRYHLEGTVVSIDQAQGRLVIDHKEIPGFMGAMTMPYPTADPKDLDRVSPGDQITADVVVGQNRIRLENIVVVKKSDGKSAPTGAQLAPSEREGPVPDFAFVNEDGKRIHLGQYRGRTVLLTFIYTRCPLPDYCPLVTHNFAEIEKALRKSPGLYDRTHLLTISFDSKYDTPAVLRNYAKAFVAERGTFQHWDFATIPAAENSAVTKFFDVFVAEEQGQITHSLSTAILSPDGRVDKLYAGSDWKPDEVLGDVMASLGGESTGKISQSFSR